MSMGGTSGSSGTQAQSSIVPSTRSASSFCESSPELQDTPAGSARPDETILRAIAPSFA